MILIDSLIMQVNDKHKKDSFEQATNCSFDTRIIAVLNKKVAI